MTAGTAITCKEYGRALMSLTLHWMGFKLKGKISHFDDFEDQYYYWGSPGAVRRSLFMDNVLYTISARKVMMNDLSDVSEINSIDLPFSKDKYNVYGWQ